ncbi:HD domain-containing protein [Lachnoclostridium phytofermentans]|uniref:HD domain-containing protein n=1 Tax=Lachnoclostridium phytofermentans TaxID=66219 RepID=UPI0004DF6E4B|nr:HD domain-containing protein [Lachnoclostridium phytofermentans]
MQNRLEELRKMLDRIVIGNEPDKICMYASHMYGVSKFCTLLAEKRNLNAELATTCGMLHDIGYMAGGSSDNHAIEGAKRAETLLKEMKAYNDNEIKIITNAIANHSDKRSIHDEYDELLKDADVMDHCFYNNDFSIAEWEFDRYNNLLIEFGINLIK